MKIKNLFFLILTIFIIGLSAAADCAPPPSMSYNRLLELVGKSRGKVVIINFWATWCVPCRQEMPILIKLRETYSEKELVLLAISLDIDPGVVERYLGKNPVNYPVYMSEPDVEKAFGVSGIPKTVIYSPKGEKVLNHEGVIPLQNFQTIMSKLLGK